MSPAQLIDQFGEPSEKLSDSIWVYSDFRAKGRPVGEECDTLVVVFDRVSLLRLTDGFLMKAAIAKARVNANKPMQVAKSSAPSSCCSPWRRQDHATPVRESVPLDAVSRFAPP
jgi:hypothetical protein